MHFLFLFDCSNLDGFMMFYVEMVLELVMTPGSLVSGWPHLQVSYSAVISSCEKAGKWQQALSFFHEMCRAQVQPDVVSCNATMSSCQKGGHWQLALSLFEAGIFQLWVRVKRDCKPKGQQLFSPFPWRQCQGTGLFPMSSASMLPSALVSEVAIGMKRWIYWKPCCRSLRYRQTWWVSIRPWLPFKRTVSGSKV